MVEFVVLVVALLGVMTGIVLLAAPVVRRARHRRDPGAVQRARLAQARAERQRGFI